MELLKRIEALVLAIPRWLYRRVVADQANLDRRGDEQRAAIRETVAQMAEAMRHYELAWRGTAAYRAETEALAAAARAGGRAREINDETSRSLVATWRQSLVDADMKYREGAPPPSLEELRARHEAASESLSELLRR